MRWERKESTDCHVAYSGSRSIGYVVQLRPGNVLGPPGNWIWRLNSGEETARSYIQRKTAQRALERAWAVWISDRGLVDALARGDA